MYSYGATPIVTKDYVQAMLLATHCDGNDPSLGLRWIETPVDLRPAFEFASGRRFEEEQALRNAEQEKCLQGSLIRP